MKISPIIFASIFFGFFSTQSFAAPTGTVDYKQGDTTLEGYLVTPKTKGKHPAIIVVHEWMGITGYTKKRAQMLADLGYVAFAADIYGKGVRPKNTDEAGALATKYKEGDRALMRARALAAYDYVAKLPNVNPKKIVVLGYCFGGTTALELARSGVELAGTVSFHGGLSTANPEDAKNIKGKVLALHGGDDPYVPQKEVEAFQQEMRNAKVDWQFISYGGAVHSFTNWDTPMKPGAGAGYNASADKRSWIAMKDFLKEILQ